MTPSKSIHQKINDDFKENYAYVRVGALLPMHKQHFFFVEGNLLEREKDT